MVHFAQLTLSLDWHLGNMASSSGGTLLQVLAGPGVVMLMNIGIYLNIFLHGKESISKLRNTLQTTKLLSQANPLLETAKMSNSSKLTGFKGYS